MIRLDLLDGDWALDRRIEDYRAGSTGRFTGTAAFRPDGTGLRQIESGHLQMGDAAPVRGQREYLWRDGPDGGLEVLFADGRPFHRVASHRLSDRHDCPPDTYDVTYDLQDFPKRWQQTWRVTGPRKNYRMVTVYTRI